MNRLRAAWLVLLGRRAVAPERPVPVEIADTGRPIPVVVVSAPGAAAPADAVAALHDAQESRAALQRAIDPLTTGAHRSLRARPRRSKTT